MAFGICNLMLKSSERYCLIIDKSSQLPVYYPNLFITTQIRNESDSVSTMVTSASCITILLNFLEIRNIDLIDRIYTKQFLNISEIEDLRNFSQKKINTDQKSNVKRLSKKQDNYVTSKTQYSRLTVIYKYIEWLGHHLVDDTDDMYIGKLNSCIRTIKENRPHKKGRNGHLIEKSLSSEEIEVLFEIVRIDSPLNPFKKEVQRRNRLIVFMLYYLGVRGGELLNIKISDINFSSNQLSILRRADEKTDTRLVQPLVKTNDRVIPLRDVLAKEIHDYVLNERNNIAKKKKHDYLFVTHKKGSGEGLPLNYAAYNRVIRSIKESSPNLKTLTGHMLRHTWNAEFSKRMDSMDNAPSEERQEQLRSYLMGWKDGSGTASTYNKRFINEKAHEVALLLQNELNKD
ncbi:tyrosine-type recombinase/integrase [Serratia symbiotica]|uniref:tyrosine-type recombinase/integrase n=1 Tax=Serratia symbiotica TaxID=138074 RepID=UPI00132307C4|nr:site-specific integrase [Serratia symbiotica]QTP14804.1 site-specific integrase [Serratia symbiotica]